MQIYFISIFLKNLSLKKSRWLKLRRTNFAERRRKSWWSSLRSSSKNWLLWESPKWLVRKWKAFAVFWGFSDGGFIFYKGKFWLVEKDCSFWSAELDEYSDRNAQEMEEKSESFQWTVSNSVIQSLFIQKGGAASKLSKIRVVRKSIARVLTVTNQKQKAELRKFYAVSGSPSLVRIQSFGFCLFADAVVTM